MNLQYWIIDGAFVWVLTTPFSAMVISREQAEQLFKQNLSKRMQACQ